MACIFLNGAVHYFFHRAVMAEVNHLTAGGLDDAAHDVDGGVVAIEECRCCYNANFMLWDIRLNLFHTCY